MTWRLIALWAFGLAVSGIGVVLLGMFVGWLLQRMHRYYPKVRP